MEKTQSNFKSMSLGDHLEELRLRVIMILIGLAVGAIISLVAGKYIIEFMTNPYLQIDENAKLQVLAPADGFTAYMKIILIAGVIIASPWIFYQLWLFVSAGLYLKEKKFVYIFMPVCALLFIVGCLFCILVAVPFTLVFFVDFNKRFLNVESAFTFSNYVDYIVNLMLVFGLAFQTPVAMLICYKVGMIDTTKLKLWRKYVLLAIFIVAAVVTPPDPISQIALAIPLYLLYELGIVFCWIFRTKPHALASVN